MTSVMTSRNPPHGKFQTSISLDTCLLDFFLVVKLQCNEMTNQHCAANLLLHFGSTFWSGSWTHSF